MGSNVFCQYQPTPDPAAAFREAAERAAYENGHGGYTGSLAEKRSYTVIDKLPRSRSDAQAYASALIDANDERVNDKWGPAGALAVADDPAPATTSTRTVTVRNDDPKTLLALRPDRHLELAREKLARSLAPNERVTAARLVSVDVALREQHEPMPQPVEVVYAVTGYGYQGVRHATLEAARAELAALADRARVDLQRALARIAPDGRVPPVERPTEYRIQTLVGSGFGQSAMERTTLVHDGETLTLEATIARYAHDPNAKTVGWLFFGWASS